MRTGLCSVVNYETNLNQRASNNNRIAQNKLAVLIRPYILQARVEAWIDHLFIVFSDGLKKKKV